MGGEPVIGLLSSGFASLPSVVALPVAASPGGHDSDSATASILCRYFHILRLIHVFPFFP